MITSHAICSGMCSVKQLKFACMWTSSTFSFTMQHIYNAYAQCHELFCQNSWMYRAGVRQRGFCWLIVHCVL